jgi:hypothetical protein
MKERWAGPMCRRRRAADLPRDLNDHMTIYLRQPTPVPCRVVPGGHILYFTARQVHVAGA